MKTLVKNAHIISPDVDLLNASVLIENKIISGLYLTNEPEPSADTIIDAVGKMLIPGFIDIHIHGHSGYDICDGTEEAIKAICMGKLSEGVTSFLGTTLTVGEDQLFRAAQSIARYMAIEQNGAKIAGIHLEGPFINPECVGAQNPRFLQLPNIELVKRINKIFPVRIVSYSIELQGALGFTRQLSNMCIIPSCAHSAGTYNDFIKAHALGLSHMTHFCNIMTPLHHLEFGLVGGGLLHNDIFVEIICDKIHLSTEMIQLIFKVKGTEKVFLITDAMRATGMPDGIYDLGGQKAVVKNGYAKLDSGVVAGSTLLYNQGLRNTFEITGLPLKELIKSTSWNQARSLGIKNLGKIAAGYIADMLLLNDDFSLDKIFVNGQEKYVD
jgi:N-acetylglucosamine-6-phosphate deacetylase